MLRNEIPGSHGTLYTGIVDRLSLSLSLSLPLSLILTLFVLGVGLGEGGICTLMLAWECLRVKMDFPISKPTPSL